MHSKISAFPLLILTASLVFNNGVDHVLLQFWWAPLVLCFAFLQYRIIDCGRISATASIIHCIISSILAVFFVFLFNHTATIFLIGAWVSIAVAVILFSNNQSPNTTFSLKRNFLTIGTLISISLLLLPISINQVLIKFPSLSGQTHFSIHNSSDNFSVPSSYFHHRVANHEEVKLKISASYFPRDNTDAPLLKLNNMQDGVRFVIQDIQYRHTLGLFSKTFFRVGESKIRNLKIIKKDDSVEVTYPGKGGMRIEKLPIESSIWIALPKFSMDLIDSSHLILIYVARLIFWLFILMIIANSRPKREIRGDVANGNS